MTVRSCRSHHLQLQTTSGERTSPPIGAATRSPVGPPVPRPNGAFGARVPLVVYVVGPGGVPEAQRRGHRVMVSETTPMVLAEGQAHDGPGPVCTAGSPGGTQDRR